VSSRKDAIAKGLKSYIGRPCPGGHDGLRYTKTGNCVHCMAAIASSPQKKAYDVAYQAANRDRIAAGHAARYLLKRSERIANIARWQSQNRDLSRSYKEKNKAHRRQLSKRPAPWFGELDELVMVEARLLARMRGAVTGLKWHVDHEIPLRGRLVSGLHVWNNIRVIPATVNQTKSNHWTP
jgi:hypothetical protein